VFWWLRRRIINALLRQAISTARLRISILVVLSVIFWSGLYLLFAEGFELLTTAIAHAPTRAQTVQAIYNIFFLSLLVMLTISSGIIFYSNVFRSVEVAHLLTTPTSARRIVLLKFQESALFSCWGFLLLGSPMLIAYGQVALAPWYYYVMLLPFMLSFVFIPAGWGAIFCLLLVYGLPHLRLRIVLVTAAALGIASLIWVWFVFDPEELSLITPAWLEDKLARLKFSEQRLLPSWWLSSGLLEAAHRKTDPLVQGRPWQESVMFLGVLFSNAVMTSIVLAECGQRMLRPAYSRLQGVLPQRRRARTAWIDRVTLSLTGTLSVPMRLLIVKDLRLFRRDPVQWSQVVIFLGLLSLYFMNIRRFQYGDPLRQWMNMIGFLNLGVVGLILSTFTTRFIFPMISLEGQRFWILGSLPIRRDAVLWSKFAFACGGSVVPCSLLILLSDAMLGIAQSSPDVTVIHQINCWTLCIGLSAIAVGLGAKLPNMRESSPSRIAAGFGGTLNLVLSAVFIVAVVLFTAVPCYFMLEARETTNQFVEKPVVLGTTWATYTGLLISLLIGVVATVVPLQMGFRAFRDLEF